MRVQQKKASATSPPTTHHHAKNSVEAEKRLQPHGTMWGGLGRKFHWHCFPMRSIAGTLMVWWYLKYPRTHSHTQTHHPGPSKSAKAPVVGTARWVLVQLAHSKRAPLFFTQNCAQDYGGGWLLPCPKMGCAVPAMGGSLSSAHIDKKKSCRDAIRMIRGEQLGASRWLTAKWAK